jgi:hypothetical protein
VAVGAKGDGRVLAESSCDGDDVDAGGEQLGGDVVPQVMQPDIEVHPVAQAVEAAGHDAGIYRFGSSRVGTQHKGVLNEPGAAHQRSFDLALMLLAEQTQCHGINRHLTDASLCFCPVAQHETCPADTDDGSECDCPLSHVHG